MEDVAEAAPQAVVAVTPRGDEADLFRAHHERLVAALARHLGGERHLAEEACSLAWVQLLRFQPERTERLVGWLFTVAKHEAYRLLRRRQLAVAADHDADKHERRPAPATADPFEALAQADLLALIARLSPHQRLALGLFARGYSYREICAATGKSYTWVNRHISEGRARIRELAREHD